MHTPPTDVAEKMTVCPQGQVLEGASEEPCVIENWGRYWTLPRGNGSGGHLRGQGFQVGESTGCWIVFGSLENTWSQRVRGFIRGCWTGHQEGCLLLYGSKSWAWSIETRCNHKQEEWSMTAYKIRILHSDKDRMGRGGQRKEGRGEIWR